MASTQGISPLDIPGSVAAALFPIAMYAALPAGQGLGTSWLFLGGAVWLIAVMLFALSRGPEKRPLGAVGITVFGALYAGGLPAFILWLRHNPAVPDDWAATWLVFLPLATTWICDTAAMAGGALLGGAKLAPALSPKKTWAGALSGAVAALVVAPVYGHLVLTWAGLRVPTGALLVIGLLIGTLGQVGDLAESLFKREAGLKDSGGFFPGHGGVLDRLDSLYWAVPLTVLVLQAWGTI